MENFGYSVLMVAFLVLLSACGPSSTATPPSDGLNSDAISDASSPDLSPSSLDADELDAGVSYDRFVALQDRAMDAETGMDVFQDQGLPLPDVSFDQGRVDGTVFTGVVRQVATSCADVNCALMTSGDVYCWGGFNGTINGDVPREIALYPRRIEGFRNIVQLSISCDSACGVDRDGAVWCLGVNAEGGLATGSLETILRSPARRMDVDHVGHLAWLSSQLLAQTTDGRIHVRNHLPPIRFNNYVFTLPSPAVDVAANLFSFCAVMANGQVACWGDFISDVRPWMFSDGPRVVPGLDNVSSIAVGLNAYCALKRDGTVWCWGINDVAQTSSFPEMNEVCPLGTTSGSNPTQRFVYCLRQPRQVEGLTDVVEVSVATWMMCARRRDGTIWCWGDNREPPFAEPGVGGIIGDGQPNTEECPSAPWIPASATPRPLPCRHRPTQVVGLTDAISISVEDRYACAALRSGQIWCWGRNSETLGDGTDISRRTPVPVLAFPGPRDG